MKLSDTTLSLFKNFSTINQSILIKKGNQIRTISVMKNILAEATIGEDFPKDFGIYDLNQFLNVMSSLHQNPDLDFSRDDRLVIHEGDMDQEIFFASPDVIVSPPETSIKLPSEDVTFELNTQQLTNVLKASSIYQVPDLSVVGANGVVTLVVRDKKNSTSQKCRIVVGETEENFTLNFKVENFKILPGSYTVSISEKLLSRFESKNLDLTYYIALEPDSTFG
jgi:hypothetical protein|tara:strand:- start:41 stop:709 length:669 start_codon:yes stop_codon:yes gene_type:complete